MGSVAALMIAYEMGVRVETDTGRMTRVWLGSAEHEALLASAENLLNELTTLEARLVRKQVHHVIHSDFADRARSLARSLRSALDLASQDHYAPALAQCRIALEHHVIDLLIMLGRTYVQRFKSISEERFQEWKADRAAGDSAYEGIVSMTRSKKGDVRVVREGLRSDTGDQILGIHYFLMQQYSPFMGSPGRHAAADDGCLSEADRRRLAEENKAKYDVYLRWSSLVDSLQFSGLATETETSRLEVHYRFLSAFVHPATDLPELVYGRNVQDWPRYDHYSSELVLLYANVIAVRELRAFQQMTTRPPLVDTAGWDSVDEASVLSERLTSHFWFIDQQPTAYDYAQAANTRTFRMRSDGDLDTAPVQPTDLAEEDIPYYQNPLARLVGLHSSVNEMTTGVGYLSPWPRGDTHLR